MQPFKEKMFREKPYTKCFECIQGNKIKCKKCMATLVQNFLKQKQSLEKFHHNKSQNRLNFTESKQKEKMMKTETFNIHKQQEQFQVSTNYELWISKMRQKRSTNYNMLSSTLQQWPHKTIPKSQKMKKVQLPLFQSWHSRLLNRFSHNKQQLSLMKKNNQIR